MAPKSRKTHRLPVILAGVGVAALGVGAVALVRTFLHGAPAPTKQLVQEVHLIRPPPPPPDVPPPPPPPPEEKVNIPDPQDKPDPAKSNEPPPGEKLGLDAEGSAGGDDFGLAARQGGRELVGQGGSAFAWYAGLVKSEIAEQLNQDKRIQKCASNGKLARSARVWMRSDGTVEKITIIQSTGDRECDQAVEAMAVRARLPQTPPSEMPPINIRIDARG